MILFLLIIFTGKFSNCDLILMWQLYLPVSLYVVLNDIFIFAVHVVCIEFHRLTLSHFILNKLEEENTLCVKVTQSGGFL